MVYNRWKRRKTKRHKTSPNKDRSTASTGNSSSSNGDSTRWDGEGDGENGEDGDEYVVNYSQCPDPGAVGHGGQNISFAVSTDLLHWDWLKDDWFSIDPEFYSFPGRWDCIAVVPDMAGSSTRAHTDFDSNMGTLKVPNTFTSPEPPYYGFWTGSPSGEVAPWGFGHTDDGVTWAALKPPQVRIYAIVLHYLLCCCVAPNTACMHVMLCDAPFGCVVHARISHLFVR